MFDEKFSFDDLLLVPGYSDTEREDIDISSRFFDIGLDIPILSSPMDTITGKSMILGMFKNGGLGIHHRGCDFSELMFATGYFCGIAVCPSMGIENIKALLSEDKNIPLVMDVSHGSTKRNLDFCEQIVKLGANLVSGNIINQDAARRYYNIGVKYFRVGIGSGSVCTTRLVTGVGYPQAHALIEINELRELHPDMRIISDGGHRTTGDIVKALALGADFVMLGGMLSGTDEVPEKGKTSYRGMASMLALSSRGKGHSLVEGMEKEVEYKGPVGNTLKEIKLAIEQACYYTGSRNLKELRDAEKILLTYGGMQESYIR